MRGTPQQVIDKYLSLARDAQLSGDRVTAENFHQHAEHYARILITMQESANQDRRDQSREQSGAQEDRGQDASGDQRDAKAADEESGGQQGREQSRSPRGRRGPGREAAETERSEPKETGSGEQPSGDGLAAIDAAKEAPGIVETPEDKPKPAERRPRRPRAKTPKAAPEEKGEASAEVAE